MRLQLVSDIHLETRAQFEVGVAISALDGKDEVGSKIDVLVMAGDIYLLRQLAWYDHLIATVAPLYEHIVHVNGNHEYYRIPSLAEGVAAIEALESKYPNFHHLDNSAVEINGHRFYGGTMWFPRPTPEQAQYRFHMNDFHLIPGIEPWCYNQHASFVKGLRANVRKGDIVVSHHLPSNSSVDAQYAGSPLNPYFVADVEKHIKKLKPSLWLHGHTHTPTDYMLGSTRVICNPTGYPNEYVPGFNPKCVVEVP